MKKANRKKSLTYVPAWKKKARAHKRKLTLRDMSIYKAKLAKGASK